MKVKKISKDEQIRILREELKRKNKQIEDLKKEKELLFKLSIKTTQKMQEEQKFKENSK